MKNHSRVSPALIADMIFSAEDLVAYISQAMTLLPGDVVLTGTPEGVGSGECGRSHSYRN